MALDVSKLPELYWLTRDEDVDGHLSAFVDVWTARPVRTRVTEAGGWMWLGPDEDGLEHRLGCAPKAAFRTTIPETSRECVRAGHELSTKGTP